MSYVDGFVLCVAKDKLEDYRKMAERASKVWREHGAINYKECVGDDMGGNEFCTNFLQLAKPKENELVLFSFITFKSREHRDEVNKKVMADERIKNDCQNCADIFDLKRMAYGGFKVIVEA